MKQLFDLLTHLVHAIPSSAKERHFVPRDDEHPSGFEFSVIYEGVCDIKSSLLEEFCIRGGLPVEYLPIFSDINIGPKWCHQPAITTERKSSWSKLFNFA